MIETSEAAHGTVVGLSARVYGQVSLHHMLLICLVVTDLTFVRRNAFMREHVSPAQKKIILQIDAILAEHLIDIHALHEHQRLFSWQA